VNKNILHKSLRHDSKGMESNATKSVPAPVINLQDICLGINTNDLMDELAAEYFKLHKADTSVREVTPSEENYPGWTQILNEFTSWQWVYGKTPKFTVSNTITAPSELFGLNHITVKLQTYHGLVENVQIEPADLSFDNAAMQQRILEAVIGQPFCVGTSSQAASDVVSSLGLDSGSIELRRVEFILSAINETVESVNK